MVQWIPSVPAIWLIYHIFTLGISHSAFSTISGDSFTYLATIGVLADFKMWRNIFYAGYAVLFLFIGMQIITSPKGEKPPFVSLLIRSTITSLLLTTFSYAIAAMLMDAYRLVLQ